jgi:two-component system, OmpR family, KDP operon response regulator KdpE
MNSLGLLEEFLTTHTVLFPHFADNLTNPPTPRCGCMQKDDNAMNNATLLVVDDEPQIRRVLRTILLNVGYAVVEAKNGQEGIEGVLRERPDLILMDFNLPDMSGPEACRKIRLSFAGPIIMVTVRNSERDKIDALDSGADDYVVKPFVMGELLARVRAALRRSTPEQPLPKIETPELTVDVKKRAVDVCGDRIHLTPREFDVLRVLVTEQGKPLTYRNILRAVWGPDYGEETENLRVVINKLRKKIEKDPAHPRFILTEPWIGYRFQLPSEAPAKRPHRKL